MLCAYESVEAIEGRRRERKWKRVSPVPGLKITGTGVVVSGSTTSERVYVDGAPAEDGQVVPFGSRIRILRNDCTVASAFILSGVAPHRESSSRETLCDCSGDLLPVGSEIVACCSHTYGIQAAAEQKRCPTCGADLRRTDLPLPSKQQL
jgi:hypothetical protein